MCNQLASVIKPGVAVVWWSTHRIAAREVRSSNLAVADFFRECMHEIDREDDVRQKNALMETLAHLKWSMRSDCQACTP